MKTLNEFYDHEFFLHVLQYRTPAYKQMFRRLYECYVRPDLGLLKMDKLDRRAIQLWFRNRSATAPIIMNKALTCVSQIMICAMDDFELMDANPCVGIKKNSGQARTRYASPLEFKLLTEVIKKYEPLYPHHVAVIKLLALTGARPTEIIRMKWKDIKFKDDCYVLESGTGKTGFTTLIFSVEASKLINSFPLGKDTVCGLTLASVKDVWYKIRKEAGLEDLWLRDLRRTFATRAFSNGMDIGMVGELLNHKSLSSTKVYAKLMLDSRIKAVKGLEENLFEEQNPLSQSQSEANEL